MKKIIPFKKEIVFKSNISEITSISLEHQLNINNLNITGEFFVNGEYKMSDKSITVEPFDLKIPFEIVLDEKYDTSKAICDIDDFYYEIINNSILAISIDVCIDKIAEVLIKDDIPDLRKDKDIIEELFNEQTNSKENHDEEFDDQNIETNKFYQEVIKADECVEEEKLEDIKEEDREKGDKFMDERLFMMDKTKESIKELNDNITESKDNVNGKINSLFNQMTEEDTYISYNVYIIREGDTIESISEKYAISEEEIGKYNNLTDLKLGDKLIIPNIQ